jgi:hypothetical protein
MKIRLGGIFCHGFLHYDPDAFRAWTMGRGPKVEAQVEPVAGDMWVTVECLPTGDVLVCPVLCEWAPRHKRAWNTLEKREWWVGCRAEMTNLKVKVDTGKAVWRRLEEIQRRSVIEYLRPQDVRKCWNRFDERERPFMETLAQEFARSLGEDASETEKVLGIFLRIVREMFIGRGEIEAAALTDEQLYHYFGACFRRTR